ncbi:histidine kinase [Dokdonia pacifica]|uniref:2TM domain-containing protein n=1 Tax=Dokdonia pacifica TaxID=1627892 RepID=A0A239D112_9FLAO|nr:2TM domain-containing protein [Dokdonia pacifica]GGG04033.1 histidine kinase [Dokdonia pacifica]SNS26105.1 2TM domain-containing protein [Dokdonia pacifica]
MAAVDQEKLQRAKKQIADEKGWYSHLFIYLVINTLLQLFYFGLFDDGSITGYMPWWVHFTTPFFWGIGLLGHWIKVFKKVSSLKFYKEWEARKIKQFMEEEEEDFSHVIKKRSSKNK